MNCPFCNQLLNVDNNEFIIYYICKNRFCNQHDSFNRNGSGVFLFSKIDNLPDKCIAYDIRIKYDDINYLLSSSLYGFGRSPAPWSESPQSKLEKIYPYIGPSWQIKIPKFFPQEAKEMLNLIRKGAFNWFKEYPIIVPFK